VDLLETLSKKKIGCERLFWTRRQETNWMFPKNWAKLSTFLAAFAKKYFTGSSLNDHGYPDITLNGENKINFAH